MKVVLSTVAYHPKGRWVVCSPDCCTRQMLGGTKWALEPSMPKLQLCSWMSIGHGPIKDNFKDANGCAVPGLALGHLLSISGATVDCRLALPHGRAGNLHQAETMDDPNRRAALIDSHHPGWQEHLGEKCFPGLGDPVMSRTLNHRQTSGRLPSGNRPLQRSHSAALVLLERGFTETIVSMRLVRSTYSNLALELSFSVLMATNLER